MKILATGTHVITKASAKSMAQDFSVHAGKALLEQGAKLTTVGVSMKFNSIHWGTLLLELANSYCA